MKIYQVISDSNIGGAGVLVERICEALCDEFEFVVVVPKGSELKQRFEKKGTCILDYPLRSRSKHTECDAHIECLQKQKYIESQTPTYRRSPSSSRREKRREDVTRSGIRVLEMPMAKDRSFRAGDVERFRELFLYEKPDIVHTHATFSARIGARLAGVNKILSTRHCTKEKEEKPSFLYRKIYNSVTDLTVSTAMSAKKNLIDEGVSPEKIRVIYNGSPLTPRLSQKERYALKEKLGIKTGALVLGSVARLEVVKGQDIMIEALARLVRMKRYDFHLVLVGAGSAEGMYRSLARELGVWERVHFVGFCDTPYVYQNIFDINLNASRGTETSCLATSECMSLGVVTVASNFGGNPEMIRDGITGLLFPKDDVSSLVSCILRLADEPTLYLALSSGARWMYENTYSLDRMASAYRALYRSIGERVNR